MLPSMLTLAASRLFKLPCFALLLVFLVVAAQATRAGTICELGGQPNVLMEDGDPHTSGSRLLQVWEVENAPVFWSEAVPAVGDYRQFRSELADLGAETDPVRLLEGSPTENNAIVIRNAGAWIRPAGCLEMLLIGYQHGRLNTFTSPTEFASFVLRSSDESRLRIYYYTVNLDGIGRMTPLTDPVLTDRQNGWEVLIGLHSHVFHPDQPELNGILAPSIPDADFHVNFHAVSGMQEAWITNGVHTVRMPASSFGDFQREPESR